ncbi:hypothetical protein Mal15_04790 [Stieleria maiorica]|uniref:Uncharacterized protein n=1 Tax=Stieleria maiorica TaxID=2795974 RepID=A0A5B9M5P2_9BACT|nr:hypothetical protein Mal15_04790 [Stieleria maiorica]
MPAGRVSERPRVLFPGSAWGHVVPEAPPRGGPRRVAEPHRNRVPRRSLGTRAMPAGRVSERPCALFPGSARGHVVPEAPPRGGPRRVAEPHRNRVPRRSLGTRALIESAVWREPSGDSAFCWDWRPVRLRETADPTCDRMTSTGRLANGLDLPCPSAAVAQISGDGG